MKGGPAVPNLLSSDRRRFSVPLDFLDDTMDVDQPNASSASVGVSSVDKQLDGATPVSGYQHLCSERLAARVWRDN